MSVTLGFPIWCVCTERVLARLHTHEDMCVVIVSIKVCLSSHIARFVANHASTVFLLPQPHHSPQNGLDSWRLCKNVLVAVFSRSIIRSCVFGSRRAHLNNRHTSDESPTDIIAKPNRGTTRPLA